MRYTLFLYYPELGPEDLSPDALAEGRRAFQEYARAVDDAGVLVSAEMMMPAKETTTLRGDSGEIVVQNGPSDHTAVPLAGSFVIDVAHLDAAVEWARRAPSVAWGHVEIRPTATRWVDGSWKAPHAST